MTESLDDPTPATTALRRLADETSPSMEILEALVLRWVLFFLNRCTGESEIRMGAIERGGRVERESEPMTKPRAAVSSLGSVSVHKGVVYTPKKSKDRYAEVGIDGKTYRLHRLIALAFMLPRTEEQTEVNHKDRDITNNRLENLEWITHPDNVRHSYATNANRVSGAIRKSKPVRARKIGMDDWIEFPSTMEASRGLGVHSW